jgi:diguanylate cyclase
MALNLNKAKIGQKILLFAAICGVLGALGVFRPVSLLLYTLQTKAATKPVSGDIVVVGIDSPSIREIGRWPWPRDKQAELIKKIDSYGPNSIYIDIGYQGTTTPAADSSLRNALETTRAPTKVAVLATERDDGTVNSIFSHPAAVGSSDRTTVYFPYRFGYVWKLPTTIKTENGSLQSMAGSIAKFNGAKMPTFRLDYGYNPSTIPVLSAKDIIEGTIDQNKLKGKSVVLGVTDVTQNDIHSMPGWGQRAGVLFHVVGAETLKDGLPKEWGWLLLFSFAAMISAFHLASIGLKYSQRMTWTGVIGILGASTWLTTLHIGNDPVPALALLGSVGFYVARQKAALIRSRRNAQTGFSDMTGYMVEEVVSNAMVIGATLYRAETRLGYELPDDDKKIMKEAAHRLSTVIDEQQLTHNEHRQFFWEMPSIATSKLAEHLEGLRLLFAEPLTIDGRKIDVDISFGVDRNTNVSIKSRMESALEASVEASKSQSIFKIATTSSFAAHLKTQFDPEFETAIANGDIELMLEAQKDLTNECVESAGASLKWTHPAHGQIATTDMFKFARESGNLHKLSEFLCEQAIAAAGHLSKQREGFTVSIKISMDVILKSGFGSKMLAIAEQAQCHPSCIIFDVIDIHNHKYSEPAKKAFRDLKKHGFRVGIGDFGVNVDDIDLLRIFRPDEIFLAKGFSAELLGSTSNQIFADGALRIARASNVKTTADGIDDRDVLSALRQRGCDRGNGKIIATPLNLQDFIDFYMYQIDKKVG